MSKEWTEDFEAKMRAEAVALARKHDLSELARMVADAAPKKRNGYAVHANIPWRLIYAIRWRAVATGE